MGFFFSSVWILFTPLLISEDFFPLWFPYHESALVSFVERVMCYSEILQSVAFHARMILQKWAGLIRLPGYNRQLLRINQSFSHCVSTQSKDSGFLVFENSCFHSKYPVVSLDVYCLFCNLFPLVVNMGTQFFRKTSAWRTKLYKIL